MNERGLLVYNENYEFEKIKGYLQPNGK